MKKSEQFLENAENCAQLAEHARDAPTRLRYEQMEAAWRSLAEQQDWLDGNISPVRSSVNGWDGKAPDRR